ncbi:hypothetical protein [Pedobacter gandavensis]|uniref:T9SS C-terminal target domain-containing protein n=1 Tax=Pedobacter gandavensis TaxID=2679963 RepID=A0ABR6EWT2_9SPHI|nr:hypothetical protein [Pedobacter gandavensis]MBB2149431.1 hypothetical protein [Pedobacter gandavensis]
MKNRLNLSLLALLVTGATAITSCKKSGGDAVIDPIVDPAVPGTLADAFFDKVSYKGAFGTTDWTAGWTNFTPKTAFYGTPTVTLSGDISGNMTLDASVVYLLKGFVYVKSGATLTIPAGTVIRGDKVSKATLVVTRGGKINAEGTAAKPIVFTSNEAVGNRAPGDWGGIIILGKSTNNIPGGEGLIEGGLTLPEGNHGGTIPDDNSGVLKYVRVEFPGIAYATNNEINGITFGSVGSKTVVDYVQVSYSGDDSFEWFGGTVNAKHLVSIANVDDVFDFDNGFSGKLQYLVAQRNPELADQAGQSNGIESDNSEKVWDSSPRTRPVISNMTLIGPGTTADGKHEYANLWRRGSKMVLANSVFVGFRYGIDIRDKETGDALVATTAGNSLIKNNIYQSFTVGKDIVASGATPSFATADLLKTYLTTNGNTFIDATAAAALLESPFNLTAPNFLLKAGSVAATGATF